MGFQIVHKHSKSLQDGDVLVINSRGFVIHEAILGSDVEAVDVMFDYDTKDIAVVVTDSNPTAGEWKLRPASKSSKYIGATTLAKQILDGKDEVEYYFTGKDNKDGVTLIYFSANQPRSEVSVEPETEA